MRNSNRAAAIGPRIRRGTERIRESVPDRVAQPPGFASVRISATVRAERTRPAESSANGLASGAECGAIHAGSRKRDPALFNSGLGERSPGPSRFSLTFPRLSTLGQHSARVDSARAESVGGVKKRAARAFWTPFGLSLLACWERGTESVWQRSPLSRGGAADGQLAAGRLASGSPAVEHPSRSSRGTGRSASCSGLKSSEFTESRRA
jgi:hypothetical protein